jgi:hypothetical protein
VNARLVELGTENDGAELAIDVDFFLDDELFESRCWIVQSRFCSHRFPLLAVMLTFLSDDRVPIETADNGWR